MTTSAPHPIATVRASVSRHPAVWSAVVCGVLAVACAALGVTGLWSIFTVLPVTPPAWWSLAFGLAAAILLPLRTRLPWTTLGIVTALWVLDLVTVGGLVPLIVLLDVLYAVLVQAAAGERRRVRDAIIATVAVIGVVALLRTNDVRVALLIALQLGALFGMTYWYATSVAQATELLVLQEERAALAAQRAEQERADAVDREREDMARELHDLVAGHVAAMAIRAEAALSAPPDADRDRAALRAVRDSSLEAHEALRSMIAVLRSRPGATLAPRGRDVIPELVGEARRTGLAVEVHDAIEGPVPPQIDHALARIVQESLANCARHAAGAEVRIDLSADNDAVRVRIDSRGGAPLVAPSLAGSGWGLELLAERTRSLQGRFDAGPHDDGWTVRAVLPREMTA